MVGLDNPIHIAFLLMLLLLVFGAKRLPEMGRSLGEGLRGFKESISGESPTARLSQAHAPVAADNVTVAVDERAPMRPVAQPAAEHAPTRPVA